MKNIISVLVFGAAVTLSSCDDHLDTKNLYDKSQETFYSTPKDIEEAMNGVYNALFVTNIHSEEHTAANLLSDEMLGGWP